jgi:hypothetical protein
MAGFGEQNNETLDSIKLEYLFLDRLSNYQLSKKDPIQWC